MAHGPAQGGRTSAHLCTGAVGGMETRKKHQRPPEKGLPRDWSSEGGPGLESASFFFCVVFCPHAYKVAQAQTLLTLIRGGLSQLLPVRPWRLPVESSPERVVHHVDPSSLWSWFPLPCEKRPQYS